MNERDLDFIDTLSMKAKVMRLQSAEVKFVKKKEPWDHICIGPDVEIGAGTIVWPGVILLGNTKIGEGCEIEQGVKLENTCVGNNSQIKQNCEMERSQIGKGCTFNSFCFISDSRVGDNCTIWVNVSMYQADVRDRVTVHRDSRIVWSSIGEDTTVGEEDSNVESYCPIKYATVGSGCQIGPNAFIEGEKFDEDTLAKGKRSIVIGHSCKVGFATHLSGWTVINPEADLLNANITNSFIGKRTKAHGCRIDDSKVLHDCIIEEGAWIHDNSIINPGCEIARGEITRSTLGKNSKAKHHGYIGDVTSGVNLNWGAGSVTGNYDGKEKHKLKIGDDVFVGVNCSIVSKSVSTIGSGADIGAHTLLTEEVEPNTLVMREAGRQKSRRK